MGFSVLRRGCRIDLAAFRFWNVGTAYVDAIADVLTDILETNSDHISTHHWTDIDVRAWSMQPTKIENGFTHHIATSHRRYGANCRTYYSFYEAEPA